MTVDQRDKEVQVPVEELGIELVLAANCRRPFARQKSPDEQYLAVPVLWNGQGFNAMQVFFAERLRWPGSLFAKLMEDCEVLIS